MKRLLVAALLMGSASLVRAQAVDAKAQYEDAYQAMLAGDFAKASGGFAAAAAMTDDPELRMAANQLARLANDLASRNARLAFGAPASAPPPAYPPTGAPPGAPMAPDGGAPLVEAGASAAVSEDDARDGGRATFVVTTTIAAAYSGFVLDVLLEVDDIRTGTLVVLGATAGGVLGSLYGTKDRKMTGGMADSWALGLTVGAANSLLLSEPLGLWDGENAAKKVTTTTLLASWGTAAAGLAFADHYQPTRGQVGVTGTFGMMGVASTLLTLAIIQPDDIDGDSFLTITALGLDASLIAGGVFASKLDWSQSRARYVGLGAGLGALAGAGGSLLVIGEDGDEDSARMAAGLTLAGIWGGFALTTHLTRDMAPDYRFRVKPAAPQMTIAPSVVKNAPGLAVLGSF
jgi:hypothetical protein